MKKFFLIFAVIITLISNTTCYGSYYSEWANNLFNVIEQNYNTWFSPSQNTYRKLVPSTGATLYYRLYGNNGLVVHISIITSQYGVYYIIENQWYYLGELPEIDSMLCQNSCEPSDENNSFWNNLDIGYNNSYGNNFDSGYNSSYWDNLSYWDNPDIGERGCYIGSWNYSTHECEFEDDDDY